MKTAKKILVTFLATVMLSITFHTVAFASELDLTKTEPTQETVTEDSINNNINSENTSNTENSSEQQNPEKQSNGLPADGKYQVTVDGSYIDEDGQLYVVDYVDEEGQVHYKKAEEIVIEDLPEEETKDEEAEAEKTEPAKEKPSYSEKDLRLLACLIYSEAGNQSYQGMLGVANVVLNRVHSDVYWHVDTIKEAIYDRKWSVQFAVTIKNKNTGLSILDKALKSYDTGKFSGSNPSASKKAMQRAIKAAKAALEGENNIGGFLCFQNKRSANSIKKKYSDYKIIGDHIFYRTK